MSLCVLLLAPVLALAATERGPRQPTPRSAPADDPAGARVIVKYKALSPLMRAASSDPSAARGPQQAALMALRHRLPLTDGRIIDRRSQVLFASGVSSSELAARLATDADVEYAVPDRRRRALAIPNDPLFPTNSSNALVAGQWYLRAPDSTLVSAINAVGAWDVTTGSPSIVVAILDTGVIRSHPDLVNKLLGGYDFIADSSDARDGNGRDSDPSDAGDWATANQCGDGEAAADSSWHGTVTAGLVGAQTNNGVGMASVGYNVMVLPVRVLGPCGGYDSDILAGMRWAAGISSNPVANPNPARVINLSLGSQGSCSAGYRDAINELTAAGVVVVASAGNDEGLAVAEPANCEGVIAVAGLRHAGTKVGYSSLGPQVAIAGPAGNCVNSSGLCLYSILSTTNAGTRSPAASTYTDGVNYAVGTSFTSPLVAGTAALMLSANPSLTPAQVRSLIQSSARAFPSTSSDPAVPMCRAPTSVVQDECICTTSTCGAGMLDASAAVVAAAATAKPEVRVQGGGGTWVVGDALTLDGSSSSVASDRSVRSYAWTITAGSGLARIDGANNAASVRLVATGAGAVTVQLTVTDSLGSSASVTTLLNVTAAAAPTVRLLSSTTVASAGSSVSFDGSSSSVASGLAVAAYQWVITSGGNLVSFSGSTSGPTATVVTTGAGSGSFTVQLTVTDSLGQQSNASSTVSLTALAPSASISSGASSVSAGNSISFDASGSSAPSGRSIASYAWAITSGGSIAAISGSSSGPLASVMTSGAGSFTIRLTVTDSAGAQDTRSSTVTVTAASTGSGGGGGGAVHPAWLLGLALVVLGLARAPRQH